MFSIFKQRPIEAAKPSAKLDEYDLNGVAILINITEEQVIRRWKTDKDDGPDQKEAQYFTNHCNNDSEHWSKASRQLKHQQETNPDKELHSCEEMHEFELLIKWLIHDLECKFIVSAVD